MHFCSGAMEAVFAWKWTGDRSDQLTTHKGREAKRGLTQGRGSTVKWLSGSNWQTTFLPKLANYVLQYTDLNWKTTYCLKLVSYFHKELTNMDWTEIKEGEMVNLKSPAGANSQEVGKGMLIILLLFLFIILSGHSPDLIVPFRSLTGTVRWPRQANITFKSSSSSATASTLATASSTATASESASAFSASASASQGSAVCTDKS